MKQKTLTPKILIFGAGAVGAFYGGKLAQVGAHVSVVCRSDHNFVKKNGFKIKSIWGNFSFKPKHVLSHTNDYKDQADYLIITSKVLKDNPIPLIQQAVHPNTSILLLQNGIDIEKPYQKAFPKNDLYSGLAFCCINRTGPGQIHHLDFGRIVLGKYPHGTSQKLLALAQIFKKAEVPCQITNNIILERFKKLIWNAPFNPLSVLTQGMDTQQILKDPHLKDLVYKIMLEIHSIANSYGYKIPMNVIHKHIIETKKMVAYKPSMLLDWQAGKPLETDAILGNAITLAQAKHIHTPCLDTIFALLQQYS